MTRSILTPADRAAEALLDAVIADIAEHSPGEEPFAIAGIALAEILQAIARRDLDCEDAVCSAACSLGLNLRGLSPDDKEGLVRRLKQTLTDSARGYGPTVPMLGPRVH